MRTCVLEACIEYRDKTNLLLVHLTPLWCYLIIRDISHGLSIVMFVSESSDWKQYGLGWFINKLCGAGPLVLPNHALWQGERVGLSCFYSSNSPFDTKFLVCVRPYRFFSNTCHGIGYRVIYNIGDTIGQRKKSHWRTCPTNILWRTNPSDLRTENTDILYVNLKWPWFSCSYHKSIIVI